MATHQPRFSSAMPRSCGPECCEAVEGLLGANKGPVHRNKELGQWTAHSLDHLVGNGGTTMARVKSKCHRILRRSQIEVWLL
jgi:hypothetical protein